MARGYLTKRGDSWRIVVDAGIDPITGKRRQLTKTVRGTKREAEAAQAGLLNQVAEGRAVRTRATLEELLEAWYAANVAEWSPRTALENRRIIKSVIVPALGPTKLAKLRTADIDAFYGRARAGKFGGGRPLAASTVRKYHAVLRSALQQGVRWEWLAVNPVALAQAPRGKRKEPTPPTPDELSRLLSCAEAEEPDFYVYLRLAASLGARRGEMCGLRWTDFRDDFQVVELRSAVVISGDGVVVKETKTDRLRRVAIDGATTKVLNSHLSAMEERARVFGVTLARDAFVFSYEADGSKPWRPDSVTRRFNTLRDKLDLGHIHDLRHYVATRLIANGVDVRTVATRLGHASPTTTLNTYSHFVTEADRDAAELLAGLLPAGSFASGLTQD
jgi:integrase